MSSLSKILLRYCQSVIVALALCLVPEVQTSFAQSTADLASELDNWIAQELTLPSAEVAPTNSPAPESDRTPEFSELTNSSAPGATQPQTLPTPAVAPADFFNQPTIGSQLLLPAGQEAVQLLLAPAPETSQSFLPAALDTQLALPVITEGERQTSLAPISSQRFLPAATLPVGLLPAAQEAPSNPLAIAIENEMASTVERSTDPISSTRQPSTLQPSLQEQVGRTLARTAQSSLQAPERSVSSIPRSSPALLPASTAPRSPLPPRRSFQPEPIALSSARFTPAENSTLENNPLENRNRSSFTAASTPTTPKPANRVATVIPVNAIAEVTPVAQGDANETPESPAVASRELGIAIAPPENPSLWQSWKTQIGLGLGALALLLLALMRWPMGGGQGSVVEETDWDHLPRSKSKTIEMSPPAPAPVRPKRVSEEFLQFMEKGGLAPLRDRPAPTQVPQVSQPLGKPLASSALLDRKPRQRDRDPILPWDSDQPSGTKPSGTKPIAKSEPVKPKRSFSGGSVDLGIWITIGCIGLLGLAAWLIQFYGLV